MRSKNRKKDYMGKKRKNAMGYYRSINYLLLCTFLLGGCANQTTTDIESASPVLTEQSAACPLMETDEAINMEKEILELALTYKALYEEMDKGVDLNVVLSDECMIQIIEHLAKYGHTVTGENQNMVNYEKLEDFLLQAQNGQEGFANYYYVRDDGGFYRTDFHSADKRLFISTTSLVWDDTDNPVITYTDQQIIDGWEYTDKGYLIYETNQERTPYAFQRVKPLGERELELCGLYIRAIGYQGNNLFLVDWDQTDMAQIVFNDLYEYLYFMNTGKLADYNGVSHIPAAVFEPLFIKYFNINEEFLRENALYDSDREEYFWINFSCDMQYTILYPAPEPEVVDSWQNGDGTITMVVDAVYEYYGKDRAFTHEVTVRADDDGSFQYISNHIRPEDKENVPIYDPRSGYSE